MGMKNETPVENFYILPFSEKTSNTPIIFTFFFLIYLVGVLLNSSIITAICLDAQLHKPMYLFICNLSIVDIVLTSVTIPKLLHMLLSGDHVVSVSLCYTQLYFLFAVAAAEDILLLIMAYDRYVAICLPLYYHCILNRRHCSLIIIGFWTVAFINSSVVVNSAIYMSSCQSNIIHQFYCDIKSLTKTTCATTEKFLWVTAMEMLLLAFLPCLCTLVSYVKIFSIIFRMTSKENRKKAFSTCSSHGFVIFIYYGTCLAEYLIPSYSDVLDSVFSIIYTNITPMINPIIYSLQNCNIQSALLKLLRGGILFFFKDSSRNHR